MLITRFLLLLAYLIVLSGPTDPEKRGALWREESEAARSAVNGEDNQLRIQTLSKFHADFPENSRVLRNLAWVEQRAGNLSEAAALLEQYAEMGTTLQRGGPIYDAMAGSGLLAKVPQLRKNESPVTQGTKVFALGDPDLLVEDVAFDAGSGRYLLTSVRKKKIVSCDAHGQCRDVVVSGPEKELDGMLAIHVDAARKLLWATSAAMPVQGGFRPERDGHSELLKFDLKTFHLIKSYQPEDGKKHALGDMTVAENGDAYVSDGLSGDVYVVRHDSDKLEALVPSGVFVSPQTPALNKSESILYVPDYTQGIAKIDLLSRKVEWLKITVPLALEGIDGLYWTETGLIATQNGTSPERIVRFHLQSDGALDRFTPIEANWPGLGDPTHGVIVGKDFYFIVNSGWDRVSDDESAFKPGAPAQIWKTPLM